MPRDHESLREENGEKDVQALLVLLWCATKSADILGRPPRERALEWDILYQPRR
jgi:hypothetical protein